MELPESVEGGSAAVKAQGLRGRSSGTIEGVDEKRSEKKGSASRAVRRQHGGRILRGVGIGEVMDSDMAVKLSFATCSVMRAQGSQRLVSSYPKDHGRRTAIKLFNHVADILGFWKSM